MKVCSAGLIMYKFCGLTGAETSDVLPGINTYHSGGEKGRPYFDVVGRRNVTAIVGQTARLNCRVKNLGDQQVTTKFTLFRNSYNVWADTSFNFSSFPSVFTLIILITA